MTQEEIREKLRLHRLWVDGEEGGARADLGGAYLHGADLGGAYLRCAYFRWANLRCADFTRANLSGADFTRANLSEAVFHGARLSGAIFHGVDLSGVDLSGADLSGATGNGKEVKSAQVHTYSLVWHGENVWIGCQCKTLDEWELFDPLSEGMDEEDCANWEAHKDWIFETVRRFPAE